MSASWVERKIRTSVAPEVARAKFVRTWRIHRIHRAHKYVNYLLAVIPSIGLSPAAVSFFQRFSDAGVPAATASVGAGGSTLDFNNPLNFAILLILIGWVLFKAYVDHESVDKRSALAESYHRSIDKAYDKVRDALADNSDETAQLKSLIDIIKTIIEPARSGAKADDAYPSYDAKIERQIKQDIETIIQDLKSEYGANWTPAPVVQSGPKE
ncbi:MAG: hypothetical protein SFV19_06440 [Rhodospirillaceae bacterium]|nr:hypothetical protein [Rhodospirillaceae bacterium]